MNVKTVLGNRVIIEMIPCETMIIHGFIAMPDSASEKPSEGFIRSIGAGNGDLKLKAQLDELTVGDRVKVDSTMGSAAVRFEGKPCRIYSILDVQCVLG